MKNRLTFVLALLLALVLTLSGCKTETAKQDASDSGNNPEAPETSDFDFDGEVAIAEIRAREKAIVLNNEEAEIIRSALKSAKWDDTEPCDCIPLCYIWIGDTCYSFKNDHIDCEGKSTANGYSEVRAVLKKYFSLNEDALPTITLIKNSPDAEPITLAFEENDRFAIAFLNLAWRDEGICNCDPTVFIYLDDVKYGLHGSRYLAKGTFRSTDESGSIYEIIDKYFPDIATTYNKSGT